MEKDNSIIKEQFGDLVTNPSMADTLIKGLEDRQQSIIKTLPKYGKRTVLIGIVILIVGIAIQVFTGNLPGKQLQLVNSLQSPTIGGILSLFFTAFAYIINAVFAVWAVSFIPFFALKSFKASQTIKIPLRINSSKWIQLFAAVFLPIIAFSIFATSIPSTNSYFIINLDLKDFLYILIGTIVTWMILFFSVKWISLRFVVIHLTIYSMLLYSVIFFAYILGFGTITYGAVLGMIFFLMFSSEQLGEIIKRVSIYDIDSSIAEKISNVSKRENTIKVKEAELDVSKLDRELGNRVSRLENEKAVSKQLQKIKESQIEINSKVAKAKLDIFNKKLDLFNGIFTILSEEYGVKANKELPALLNNFKVNVKNLTAGDIEKQINKIISQVNSSLDTIPKGLDNLKIEMKKATKELKEATEELNKD